MRMSATLTGALATGAMNAVLCFALSGSAWAQADVIPKPTRKVEAAEPEAPKQPIPTAALADASPVVVAAFAKLQDKAFSGRAAKADVEALLIAYGARKEPMWTAASGLNDRAKSAVAEIAKADDWGLDARAFALPDAAAALSTPDALADAEAKVALAVLTYARHARGGRTRPLSISQMLDLTPPVKDPQTVLTDIEAASSAGDYLTGLHPQHEQFKRLKAELLKRRGPAVPEAAPDESLAVQLPEGTTLKPGSLHGDIALLRKRLKVPAAFSGQETLYDDQLAAAVKEFQSSKGLKATGQLTPKTRQALNREGAPAKAENPRDTQRIVINMERWRWMPDDMGRVHVVNNVPEYVTRTFKEGKEIFKEKIIVGQPTWPTPSFSAEMKTIVFNPSWGVPDGIKAKELKPRLQKAGGGGFFDQLFGGGGGGASVLKAYGLTAYRNGKPVDPGSIDWSNADLRQYSFIQPPGSQNPLGFVKFMFPNSHDVYMHDTTQRSLFSESRRPYSHGCIRVNNPGRFAEILLAEDKGWGADRVSSARRSSETVSLDQHIWVHNVYLTSWVDDDGKVASFGDVYGLDSRVSQALGGKAIQSYEGPVKQIETSSINDEAAEGDDGAAEPQPAKKKKTSDKKQKSPSSTYRMPESFSEAMSGLVAN